jgi:hypothetical protein
LKQLNLILHLECHVKQMYGRYTKDLGEYAKDKAKKLKEYEQQRKREDRARNKVCMMTKLLIYLVI